MPQFADLQLDEKATQVRQRLADGPVWVYGPTGSGRNELARVLSGLEECVLVEPPGQKEVDAPVHALAQTAVDREGVQIAFNDSLPLEERARDLARRLSAAHKTLLVRTPFSWSFGGRGQNAEAQRRERDTYAVLNGWLLGSSRVVVLSSTLDSDDALARRFEKQQTVNLPSVSIAEGALRDRERWGAYLPFAEKVEWALGVARAKLTPLQVRLAVGVVALGDDALATVRRVQDSSYKTDLGELIERLATLLHQRQPEAWAGLQAIALARFPIPRAEAVELSGLPPEHLPLLTQCVGYGEGCIRIPEFVRRALLAGKIDDTRHERLAFKYQQRDGARSPLQLTGPPLQAWLEKAHHLAQVEAATVPGLQRWEDLELPSRYLLWDRARSLSRQHHRYADAAALYRRSLDQFGKDDDYSWHYYAFNRQRAGQRGRDTEEAYRQAVTAVWPNGNPNLGVKNPWWNARLITYLIAGGQEQAAQQAWSQALDAIDPDQLRVRDNPWLALHFHQWVVRAWLDVGNVKKARAAFALIPQPFTTSEEKLKKLKWRLEDAEEAEALAESVYPVNTDPAARWTKPQRQAEGIEAWAPGRVVNVNKNGVDVVMAEVQDGRPIKRLLRVRISAKKWATMTGARATDASGFFEWQKIAGVEKIVLVAASEPSWPPPPTDALLTFDEEDA